MTAPFAISSGDPAGIGPEIIAKAWKQRAALQLHCFFVIGNAADFEAISDVKVIRISEPAEAKDHYWEALPVLHIHDSPAAEPGKKTTDSAQCALHALEMACGLVRSGEAGALITGPVSKVQLYDVGFTFPGQTEFVSERCGIARENAVMMLAGPSLRVIPMTTHIPLKDVPDQLTSSLVKARILAAERAIKRNFGIADPRIAVAGLNPHAGEDGKLGSEEQTLMIPVIEELQAEGLNVSGPLSADTMFHEEARSRYDVALCPYHDQALVPLKTLHFFDGVNMTLGLPIVRTSPDHGTAFEIAGQDKADPRSMIAAIKMAETATINRQKFDREHG